MQAPRGTDQQHRFIGDKARHQQIHFSITLNHRRLHVTGRIKELLVDCVDCCAASRRQNRSLHNSDATAFSVGGKDRR
jgi:hypothetical protein